MKAPNAKLSALRDSVSSHELLGCVWCDVNIIMASMFVVAAAVMIVAAMLIQCAAMQRWKTPVPQPQQEVTPMKPQPHAD